MTEENSVSAPDGNPPPAPPARDVEEAVGAIFRDVLAVDGPVDFSRSFFRIGGTSIMAAKVIARIAARFQVRLSLRTVFEHPTVEELARVVESEVRSDVAGLSDAEVVALASREE